MIKSVELMHCGSNLLVSDIFQAVLRPKEFSYTS